MDMLICFDENLTNNCITEDIFKILNSNFVKRLLPLNVTIISKIKKKLCYCHSIDWKNRETGQLSLSLYKFLKKMIRINSICYTSLTATP